MQIFNHNIIREICGLRLLFIEYLQLKLEDLELENLPVTNLTEELR